MKHLSLSAIGADRPGIVAAITGVLARSGCSLEDSEMAVLQGNFAVMLVLAAPDSLDAGGLEVALAEVGERFGLAIQVRSLAEVQPLRDKPATSFWSVSVHGSDRPGIVHAIASVLAEAGANIVALRTYLSGAQEDPLYAMVLEAEVPPGTDPDELRGRLEETARQTGVHVSMTPADDELL